MVQTLWLSGMIFANLWAASELGNLREPEAAALAAEQTPGPIQPPIKAGERPWCDNAPDSQEILRALPRFDRGIPHVYEVFRDDIEFTVENLVDRIDGVRFFPLIGPAQLHHCNWKCTVHFTETTEVFYPFPMKTQRKCSEVVYIDKDFLHLHKSELDKENLRQIHDEMRRFWMNDQPAHLKPYRIHDGVGPVNADEPSNPPATPACPVGSSGDLKRRTTVRNPGITLDDVMTMSKLGITHDIIVRQMELENAVFNLTAPDIIRLHQAGVSERIIRTMQERRTIVVQPQVIQASAVEEQTAPPRVPNQMSVAEIVRLKEIGTPDNAIVRLIAVTGSVFHLSTFDILDLRHQGVSDDVIVAMQRSRRSR